jgi:hypothetical protein
VNPAANAGGCVPSRKVAGKSTASPHIEIIYCYEIYSFSGFIGRRCPLNPVSQFTAKTASLAAATGD